MTGLLDEPGGELADPGMGGMSPATWCNGRIPSRIRIEVRVSAQANAFRPAWTPGAWSPFMRATRRLTSWSPVAVGWSAYGWLNRSRAGSSKHVSDAVVMLVCPSG